MTEPASYNDRRHSKRGRALFYTVDALTDGSEWTGNGTIFVSVYKEQPFASEVDTSDDTIDSPKNNREREDGVPKHSSQPPPLARYAISGLADVTSRLAFDQRFSLGATRALFAMPNHDNSSDNSCQCRGLEGLPALLLNLKQAGAEKLTVVLSNTDSDDNNAVQAVQDTVELLLPSYRSQHPKLQLCSVPGLQRNASLETLPGEVEPCWWMVYSDEYICVYAKRVPILQRGGAKDSNGQAQSTVVILFTLLCYSGDSGSLVVVSGGMDQQCLNEALKQLPIADDGSQGTAKIHWGIVIGHRTPTCPVSGNSNLSKDISWFYTRPCSDGIVDPGLLVRARQQSTLWHSSRPHFFPWNGHDEHIDAGAQAQQNMTRLRTGWSLVLNSGNRVDRMEHLKRASADLMADRSSWPMQCDFALSSISTRDDNEIELDDDEVTDDGDTAVAKVDTTPMSELLVLGTGCAAPSPYRGSSGHCLFLNNDFTFVFEVGDGFLTQWSRFSSRSLLSIRAIWISHAHWDHYGGLAALLSKLYEMRQQEYPPPPTEDAAQRLRKRPRMGVSCDVDMPLLLASSKVLTYLALYFGKSCSRYFRSIDIGREPNQASKELCQLTTKIDIVAESCPIMSFFIVPVDHSCADSYGFIIGLHRQRSIAPFVFCFSGDTRPCRRFISACCQCAERWKGGVVDLLLHEATFDESESKMSMEKKHSTVKEALIISQSIGARMTFLTHFSQRYNSPPDQGNATSAKWTPMFDGLLIPLFEI